jgi:hypothetical protein
MAETLFQEYISNASQPEISSFFSIKFARYLLKVRAMTKLTCTGHRTPTLLCVCFFLSPLMDEHVCLCRFLYRYQNHVLWQLL